MSDALYQICMYWTGTRGVAKLAPVTHMLTEAPVIKGLTFRPTEIQFTPEVHVALIREYAGPLREMTPAECALVEAAIFALCRPEDPPA
jgi:hypothetical protein